MKCQFCGQELPEGAKFCFKCNKQIVCQNCGGNLMPDATICVFCATEIASRSQTAGMNHIKYTETEKGKSFEASFSDATAGNVVETWAQFLPGNRFVSNQRKAIAIAAPTPEDIDAEEIPATHPSPTSTDVISGNDDSLIDRVFRIRGENDIYLHETSLKASSKVDYAGRLTILFLYYQQLQGIDEIKRTDVNHFLERTGFKNDGSYRSWMTKNKSLYNVNGGSYCLCRAGEERAKEYLADVFSDGKIDVWKLGDRAKTNGKSNGVGKKSQSKSTASYSLVGALNLNPSDKDSLKEFVTRYKPSGNYDYNIIFIYYLEKVLNVKAIDPNHIYSCYKGIGIKYPSNIRQSLFNTKQRRGWVDTSNLNDIKLTASGENAVEHDLKK